MALTAGKVKCKTFFSSCLMTASLLGQKKWFLITIQGGEVGVGGELAQPLVGKEPGFFHASLPNLSIFEKRYIYSYKYNIWEFGVCHLLSWLFVYSGLGVQLLCSEKGAPKLLHSHANKIDLPSADLYS